MRILTAMRRQRLRDTPVPRAAGIGLHMLLAAFVAGALAPLLHAQAPEPAFAAASIRVVDDPSGRLNRVQVAGDRFRATTIPVAGLIQRAYGMPVFRIVGLPPPSMYFDVEAVAEEEVPYDEMMRRLRTLLRDRFGLQARIETREMPVYVLARAREDRLGPGLRPSTLDCGEFRTALAVWDRRHIGERPQQADCEPTTRRSSEAVHMQFPAATMRGFSMIVEGWVERIVVDRTGLNGEFDVEVSVSPDDLSIYRRLRTPDSVAFAGPSVFTALREQLGLTLEPGQAPVEVLVIDSVEREPRPN